MRDRIRRFLKLRRQSDTVKIICALVLAGIMFLISVIFHVWEIYHYVNTPAEYVLTGDGVVSKQRMDELLQDESVARASRQMDVPVTVMYRGARATVNCTMLSEEYIEGMFDKKPLASTKTIYMNEAAFLELQQALQENNESTPDMEIQEPEDGSAELDIRYSLEEGFADLGGDDTASIPQYKAAKLMAEKTGKQGEGFACMAETDSRLLKEAVSIRVQFKNHDLDGIQISNLRKLGYSIENENVLITEEYEVKIKLLHIQYGLLCFFICLTGAVTLWHLEKKVLMYR